MKSLRLLFILVIGVVACSSPEKNDSQKDSTPPKSMVEDKLEIPSDIKSILKRNTCLTCHRLDTKLIGPSYIDASQKLASVEEIIGLIRNPDPSRYPEYPPMAGINISDEDGTKIAEWLLSLKNGE